MTTYIDWSKVKVEEAGRLGIGTPHTTAKLEIVTNSEILELKLDIDKECNVGGTNNPHNPLVLSCNGSVGMSCQNPNIKLHINN